MTKNSDLQVSPSRRPTRERIGLIVNGINAAAAIKTSIVRLGTAIIPTYPRHPIVLAQEVLALHDIAPGRLRLGIGPSHRAIVEDIYGLPQTTPLVHLR